MIYIFDIDGTLADLSHRLKFIQQPTPDWPAFFAACGEDAPIADVILLAQTLAQNSELIYVTGRSSECREATVAWLKQHKCPTWARYVYMRKAGDHRHDHIVKAELLDQLMEDWRIPECFQIGGVFEDRKQVVDMYRARGLRVFQVAEGNF